MARPNKVEQLEPEIRDMIGRLRDRGRSLDEIMDQLRPLDADVSRSGLHRYLKSQAVLGERLRRSRAVADVLVRQFGEGQENKLAAANIELIQDLFFQWFEKMADADEAGGDGEAVKLEATPQTLMFAAKAMEHLGKAKRHNLEYITDVQKKAAEAAKTAAAKAMDAVGKEKGVSADTIAAIKAAILGVQAKPA